MTEILTREELSKAAGFLRENELVAFPTETVYGLGARLSSESALLKIFKTKGRPADNPLIVHVASIEQIEKIARELPPAFYKLAKTFFPGPLTIILKRSSHVSSLVSAGLDTIAVRMPSHPVAKELIEALGEPIAAPSANLSGKPSSTTSLHVLEDFQGKIAAVIEGGSSKLGLESTVINLTSATPQLMRPGHITKEELEAVLGEEIELCLHAKEGKTPSPGMKYRHYAPLAKILVFTSLDELLSYAEGQPAKKRMLLARQKIDAKIENGSFFPLNAQTLYANLRLSDRDRYEEILLFCDPETLSDAALMNRISHASAIH